MLWSYVLLRIYRQAVSGARRFGWFGQRVFDDTHANFRAKLSKLVGFLRKIAQKY